LNGIGIDIGWELSEKGVPMANSPTASLHSLTRWQAWSLSLAATFTMAISYLDRQMLAVMAPTITATLQISETRYGFLASAFSIAYLVGAPLAGRWVDKIGARRGLLIAVLVWSLVAAVHSTAMGFYSLFLLRIGLGLAESPSFPGATQIVHRAMPANERARALGLVFTGSSFGAMVAPLLARWLHHTWGWRSTFVGTAIVGLSWVPMWLYLTRSAQIRKVLDQPLQPVVANKEVVPDVSTWELMTTPAVMRTMGAVLAFSPPVAFVLLWSSKYLVFQFHLTQQEVTSFLWVPPLMFDLGSILFGDLASRLSKRNADSDRGVRILFGCATFFTLLLVTLSYAQTPWRAMILAGLCLMGTGGAFALFSVEMISNVPSNRVSSAGGITAATQSIAYMIATPLMGWSIDRFGSYQPLLWALGLWCLPGACLWIWWPKRRHTNHI
jgi:MFS transporter, ACS family, hexuronate transporter